MAAHLAAALALQCEPETRQHEPRGLLGYTERAREFVAADAVLAVGEQPQSGQPLFQTDGRVLEDGSYLQRELRFGMFGVALVAPNARQIGDVIGVASRTTNDALGPADRLNGLAAILVIREKQDGLSESFGRGVGCHEHIMAGS